MGKPKSPQNEPAMDEGNLPAWIENPDEVTELDRIRAKNLKPTHSTLNERFPNGWGDTELDALIVERRMNRLNKMLEGQFQKKAEDADIEAKVKAIVDNFRLFLPNPLPNDEVKLEQMARIQLTMDEMQRQFTKGVRNKSTTDMESVAKVIKDLNTAYKGLEKDLGIDRQSRHKESDASSMMEDAKRQAVEILKRRQRQLICPECAKQNTKINFGFVVFHMDQNNIPFSFVFKCPKCGSISTVNCHGSENLWTISSI